MIVPDYVNQSSIYEKIIEGLMKKINLKEVFHSRKKALILLTFVAIIV